MTSSGLSTPPSDGGVPERRRELDGNAAAGELADVLTCDPTNVTVRCKGCDAAQAFGQLRAYLGGPGTVLCCSTCGTMVARVARTPQGTWLDTTGSSSWLFPPAPDHS